MRCLEKNYLNRQMASHFIDVDVLLYMELGSYPAFWILTPIFYSHLTEISYNVSLGTHN